MLVTTIWVVLIAQSFAKDLAPHVHEQILKENVESRTRMAYMSNPHYKINYIYEQRKTDKETEIEQIEEDIGKYMHHHHQPTTTTSTTEAQQNIEVVNEKDIKETTNHSTSESLIPVTEKHHHNHEKKEDASKLSPMPPAPKLQEPYNAGHPHFPAGLPSKVKNELKELLGYGLRRFPHRHPDYHLHFSRTTSEAPVEEVRTELSPLVTQSDEILNIDIPESHLNQQDSHAHELRRFPHRHPDSRLHSSRTTTEAHIEVEAQTELSPLGTPSDEILNGEVAESHLDQPDYPAHELRHISHRHPDYRLHFSRTTSETPVEVEAQTDQSPHVTQSDYILNSEVPESHSDQPDSPNHELRRFPHRHPDSRLHSSRTTMEAPVEVEAQTELSPLGTPSDEVAESHLEQPGSPAYEQRHISHRHPDYRLHFSRTTSETPVEVETHTELSPLVTQSDEILSSDVPESHFDQPDFSAHELRRIPHRYPDHRLHVSRTTSENPFEVEIRRELSPSDTQSNEISKTDDIESQSYHSESPVHKPRPVWLHISRTTSEAPVEEAGTELSLIETQSDEMREFPNNEVPGSHLNRPDSVAHELRPHRHPDHRLHISRRTSEAPVEKEARHANHTSTEKRIHLSRTSHDPSFLSRWDQNTLAKIRPKFDDVQYGSIGLPSRPRPVYRGSYKFSWDDINDMHASAVPKVSQLKENPNPPPVPTLSPWYDGYGK